MLRTLASLSFLYTFAITALLVYAFAFYRDFVRSARPGKKFPLVFSAIGLTCFFFLWINIHAPLNLKTFSNLDHHFIRHDGFLVNGRIKLGASDTANYPNSSYNSFLLAKKNGQINVHSGYSEDPFYASEGAAYRLLSKTWPAKGHAVSFMHAGILATFRVTGENDFELSIDGQVHAVQKQVKKGISAWNIFKEESSFINSACYNNSYFIHSLQQLLVVRDHVSRKGGDELRFFISGRLFLYAGNVQYDGQSLRPGDLAFEAPLPGNSYFAWGIGFLDNNRNQYQLQDAGSDSFSVLYRYPVSYPLAEEKNPGSYRDGWTQHGVTKFLVADAKDLLRIPAVFREGFLFPAFDNNNAASFEPVLLTYRKSAGGQPVQVKTGWLAKPAPVSEVKDDKIMLPTRSGGFDWVFSIRDTFNWELGSGSMAPGKWQAWLFGVLFFFFVLVLLTSLVTPAGKLSWVWQLLSAVTIVLLTTRFFLYWRYKTFPPYEGMDLPSQQQLVSFWNFGIILFATIVLAIVFGFGFIKHAWSFINRKRSYSVAETPGTVLLGKAEEYASRLPGVKKYGKKAAYFASWLMILAAAAVFAWLRHFNPATCRHLAIGLTVMYFIYLFISYRHSPLVAPAEKSWWRINTARTSDIVISNPVKVLLSVSLLAVFVFVDIGFAIVFLNFLLFNEAFLCINYAIAGLSAGSRRNAALFGASGFVYLLFFVLDILYAPYIFKFFLRLPQSLYLAGYIVFAIVLSWHLARLMIRFTTKKKLVTGAGISLLLFLGAFFFFPKEKILDKAAMTKYRIDVLTMPVDKAIVTAYGEGKTWEPVIRAAQNQWFINTFIYEENNPAVQQAGFRLLPHAPQNKGAKYNAQATDLVASRFFLAEHGKWPVLLYVLLLLLPATLLASFYKLYPDFTSRINEGYPTVSAGFSLLNYLLITALLVILAATGRYIFFGQDMPFGSILSKQSVLFPSILIIAAVLLFRNIPLEYYASRRKFIPGAIVFFLLAVMLFGVKPVFNKNKEFNVSALAKEMDDFVQWKLQPVMDYFDTAAATRRYPLAKKDSLFTDSLRRLLVAGIFDGGNTFFVKETETYLKLDLLRRLDAARILYLDLYSGNPRLAVNENYFRVEPPPHLQQSWTGNVYGDSVVYNVSLMDMKNGYVTGKRAVAYNSDRRISMSDEISLSFGNPDASGMYKELHLINNAAGSLIIKGGKREIKINPGDSTRVCNPWKGLITGEEGKEEKLLTIEPDAYMKNYFVNGHRFYVYPMADRFTWARNFAESIAADYTAAGQQQRNAVVSLDYELMDSLSLKIERMMDGDTAYKNGAEYGICIADGNGRLIAMADHIKGLERPDPNDKAGFTSTIMGENGFISQSLLRKQVGNINLLRLNPGPGSTLKPIVFSAIASQLNLNWDAFASEGFSEPQHYYGGQKVAEYDFEKNNGRVMNVADYLKYSDNYYHSNVLLLGSYRKQDIRSILQKSFAVRKPGNGLHWPWFSYLGSSYWLNGYKNWPGYKSGKADFGSDSSFTAAGLFANYGIYTHVADKSFDMFCSSYDSSLFLQACRKSGFILPEYSLFDQQGAHVDHSIPYDVFANCFRGHVKGSSQVMVTPVKMTEAFGRLVSQNRNYGLTLNPYAETPGYSSFAVDNTIVYNNYLSLMREGVFKGLKEVLKSGTAARLGTLLPRNAGYHYYAKTGTTGDNEVKTKSKLLAIVISEKDISDPGFNFRNNKFYTVYFTLQNGPAKQNEEFQAAIIRYIEGSVAFKRYMGK